MIVLATSGPATEKCSRFKYMIIGIWTFSFLSCFGVGDGGWFGIPAPPLMMQSSGRYKSQIVFLYTYIRYIFILYSGFWLRHNIAFVICASRFL